eukprot:scaffold37125_cov62-Phaeocystis_antarctica.AAC.3
MKSTKRVSLSGGKGSRSLPHWPPPHGVVSWPPAPKRSPLMPAQDAPRPVILRASAAALEPHAIVPRQHAALRRARRVVPHAIAQVRTNAVVAGEDVLQGLGLGLGLRLGLGYCRGSGPRGPARVRVKLLRVVVDMDGDGPQLGEELGVVHDVPS